jgi:hypothetical protein
MTLVRVLSMAVVLGGGALLLAEPAAAGAQRPCTETEALEAWAELQDSCAGAGSDLCAEIYECWVDIWDHVHYFGFCYDGLGHPCYPRIMPSGGGL